MSTSPCNTALVFLKRSAATVLGVSGLFCIFASSPVVAKQPPSADNRYEVIDPEEGERRMNMFRRQRLDGDYCFRFELEHLPRRGKTIRYYGTMWGSWNEQGPVTRIQVASEPGVLVANDDKQIEMILQNGPSPYAWLRGSLTEDFVELSGDALLSPILPEIVYAPFDMQMPFLYWDDFRYEGPVRVKSRIAQTFLMLPPDDVGWANSVRVGIDDAYNALLRIEVMSADSEPRSQFTVESFKKVQEQWIVKRITLKDNETGDRTRFKVRAASVGLILPEEIFLPEVNVSFPTIPESMFEIL